MWVFIAGILIGVFICLICIRFKFIGAIRIDNSIPEDDPRLFLELKTDIPKLRKKEYAIVKLIDKNYISQD
jgi:hypothetical protein